jgi:hypothetical protein
MRIDPYSRTGLALIFGPLYLGPVLAGWARLSPVTLPVFALAFLLFIAATRRPNLNEASGVAALVLMALVQCALVAACFAAGVALALLAGPIALPLWVPVALTALAAVFGALQYSDKAEMDVFLDGAIRELEDQNRRRPTDWADIHPTPSRKVEAATRQALTDLRALPDDAAEDRIDAILDTLGDAAGARAFDPLYDAVVETEATDPPLERALLRFVARPEIRDRLIERGEAGMAPTLLLNAQAPETRAAARRLVGELIDAGAPAEQLPDPAWLTDLHAAHPDEDYDTLARRVTHAG